MTRSQAGPVLSLARLDKSAPIQVLLEPDKAACAALAKALGLLGLRKLRFDLRLMAEGKGDWRLTGHLGATVVQSCVVTLAPVTTRIDRKVSRLYAQDFEEPHEAEAEMPEDDSIEAVPATLDLREVMAEELALALPDFPRADGAELGELSAAPPGAEPLDSGADNPFAALASLRKTED